MSADWKAFWLSVVIVLVLIAGVGIFLHLPPILLGLVVAVFLLIVAFSRPKAKGPGLPE